MSEIRIKITEIDKQGYAFKQLRKIIKGRIMLILHEHGVSYKEININYSDTVARLST